MQTACSKLCSNGLTSVVAKFSHSFQCNMSSNSFLPQLLPSSSTLVQTSRATPGRWWPQENSRRRQHVSTLDGAAADSTAATGAHNEDDDGQQHQQQSRSVASDGVVQKSEGGGTVRKYLDRKAAAPIYAPDKAPTENPFQLVPTADGRQLANFALWRASIDRAQVDGRQYRMMTSEERDVHMAHIEAVQRRELTYADPRTGYVVLTVAQLLLNGECCGNACRHCPYEHRKVPAQLAAQKVWNGFYYV